MNFLLSANSKPPIIWADGDRDDKTPYVLKAVNRSLYQPHDTEVIRTELKILEYFQGESNIVQPAGVAVIMNPYATSDGTEQL